jgi:hypothetical protein
MDREAVEALASSYQRYESANENKLYRAMNQRERIQRIQQGEHLPISLAVDVAVHSESPNGESARAVSNLVIESSQVESADKDRKVRTEGARADDQCEQHPPGKNDTKTEEPN